MSDLSPHCLTPARSIIRLLPAVLLLGSACVTEASLTSEHDPHELRSAGQGCGNGVLEAPEQCDDGNLEDDDGCDATCQPSGIAMVSTGDQSTCALTLAGNVLCWGEGGQGQLGQADTVTIGDDEPVASVSFVPLGAPADRVFTNGRQSFAVLDDGTVRAWGDNAEFELGLDHAERIGDDETPLSAMVSTTPTLGGPVQSVAVGDGFACALLVDGTVECWGRGAEGQLGHGEPTGLGMGAPSAGSVEVQLNDIATEITAGAAHVCARLVDGSVRCWGHNDVGQLGLGHDDDIGDDEMADAAEAVSLGGSVEQIAAGSNHTCARLEDGAVRCWGRNDHGQLGYGHIDDIGDDESPTSEDPVDLGGPAVDLIAADQHTCALLDTGALRCWGRNTDGRLGHGHDEDIGDDETPASVPALDFGGPAVASVFGGALSRHTCAVLTTGALRCWGVDDRGQLGVGYTNPQGELEAGPGTVPDVIIIEDPEI